VASVILLIAGGVSAIARTGDDGQSFPTAWDARIAPLAAYVEKERGHRFEHPVIVEFLDDAAFRREVTADDAELDEEDREEIKAAEGALRALALLPPNVDLFKEVNAVSGEATLAFYDFKAKRIRVRGTTLDDELKGTLVHELTHALQDQIFGVDREFDSDGERFGFTALVEGDALHVERLWREAQGEEPTDPGEIQEKLDEIPQIVVALFGAAHELGQWFVEALYAARGRAGVDKAFGDPPKTEEAVLDVFAYLEGDNEPHTVRPLDPPGDRRGVDRGEFGALLWYLMLAERLDPARALNVVDGWGGDTYVVVERDDRMCIRVAYLGDTASDTGRMATALDSWVKDVPGATVRRIDGRVELDSCEPAPDATVQINDRAIDALIVPLLRAGVASAFLTGGLPLATAKCAANMFTSGLEIADAQRLAKATELSAEDNQRLTAAVFACR
jgi:hypothetical protein